MTQLTQAQPSTRNLVLGRLNGTNVTVVRDITDIAHPTNVTSLQLATPTLVPWGPWKPTFIGGTEIGDGTDQNLTRIAISTGHSSIVLAGCPYSLVTFGWNTLGDYMTYVREVTQSNGWQFEWHLVGHGADRLLAVTPAWCHCDGDGPADNYSFVAGFSPDGAYVFLVEAMPIAGTLPIQIRKLSGELVASLPAGSMPAWSGSDLYFRDANGVERWRAGSVSRVVDAIPWIRPNTSPAADKIVYWVRGFDGLGRVYLVDLTTGAARMLSSQPRMEPVFLSSRYVWYEGERSCTPTDQCVFYHQTIPTGITYIYDLADGTEAQSSIAAVYDVWPHGG